MPERRALIREERPPRTVAIVLPTLNIGGAELQALELARHLPALGWRPVFVQLDRGGPLREVLRQAGIACHSVDARPWFSKASPRFYFDLARSTWRMRSLFRRERVDAVLSLLFWTNPYAVIAAKLAGVRAIVTCRLQMGSFRDTRPHYIHIEKFLNRFVHAVMVNSRVVAKDAIAREGLPRRKVVVIYNGIDVERFREATVEEGLLDHPHLRGADPLVAVVGNLKRIKRHDVFLRGFAMAWREHPTLRAVIVGHDHGELAGLKRLVAELGIANCVLFAGPRDNPATVLAAAQIAALTSDGEGLPNAIIEAMASGCAIVATRVGGIPELVREGREGLLADAGDWRGVGAALGALCDDAARRAAMGRAAQTRATSAVFSYESLAAAHVALFESILNTGAPPRLTRRGFIPGFEG
jgi:glycosyltransferase involved in cell wall biosynthesis